jgi:hypothetical protein
MGADGRKESTFAAHPPAKKRRQHFLDPHATGPASSSSSSSSSASSSLLSAEPTRSSSDVLAQSLNVTAVLRRCSNGRQQQLMHSRASAAPFASMNIKPARRKRKQAERCQTAAEDLPGRSEDAEMVESSSTSLNAAQLPCVPYRPSSGQSHVRSHGPAITEAGMWNELGSNAESELGSHLRMSSRFVSPSSLLLHSPARKLDLGELTPTRCAVSMLSSPIQQPAAGDVPHGMACAAASVPEPIRPASPLPQPPAAIVEGSSKFREWQRKQHERNRRRESEEEK